MLEQIAAEESFNTRRFDPKIFISCTKLKGDATYTVYRATIGRKVETYIW